MYIKRELNYHLLKEIKPDIVFKYKANYFKYPIAYKQSKQFQSMQYDPILFNYPKCTQITLLKTI